MAVEGRLVGDEEIAAAPNSAERFFTFLVSCLSICPPPGDFITLSTVSGLQIYPRSISFIRGLE